MKTVVVDDEVKSRQLLKTALENYTDGIEIVGEGHSVESAVSIINETNPEVLFLDIQLGDGTGFDILERIPSQKFKVIFVTAFDNYAIRAIKFSAIDYILKPIDLEDLKSAVERLKNMTEVGLENAIIAQNHLKQTHGNKIMVSTSTGYVTIDLSDIICFVAYGNYVLIHSEDRKFIATNTIQYYDDLLQDSPFYRIHRSNIVNINKVIRVEKQRAGIVTMSNGMQLDLAARRKTAFVARFKEVFRK